MHNLGYPRIGAQRQLKKALEKYWADPSADLTTVAATLRGEHWLEQKNAGVELVPTNDFSLYDHVLDTIALVGAVPERFGWSGANVDLATYFAMARGQTNEGNRTATNGHAMEMTKWFDTNYHYIVPELWPGQRFSLASQKVVNEFLEARKLGLAAKPVLLGPVTFLKLGKVHHQGFDRYDLLPGLLEVYRELLRRLAEAGAEWVQFDEPAFAVDLTFAERNYLNLVYRELSASASQLKLLVATYYNSLGPNLTTFAELPVHGLHLDLTHSGEEIDEFISSLGQAKIVSLGVIDGRNIWRANYSRAIEKITAAVATLGEDRIWLAPSCSLMHVPHSLVHESRLDPDLRSWLAFANEKLTELTELRSIVGGDSAPLIVNESVQAARASSERIHSPAVKKRVAEKADLQRESPFASRAEIQRDQLRLPELPTTTIGSFPQTEEVRAARAQFRRGKITSEEYESFLKAEIAKVVHWQEKVGLDVLVHGEFERTDMVEYFGEKLRGFAFTENGWVQSYGSRCVKPPILFGDVFRPEPMTVAWATFAQAQTEKPVKGMLTGPITILEWSFVRDDQPRSETARQLALAIRDEVADLEKAGISVIQVDEPALREGLPLREAEWSTYLRWAVDAFRLATSDVADRTQIHTHMCYSDFNTILPAIAEMDADVISIESSRSEMELLEGFRDYQYPNEVGPGIWDIHSPRVPSVDEMVGLIRKGLEVLPRSRFWVNPDCGLKTRSWREVEPALENMVAAAKVVRAEE
ncbi:MAG: 5-methyltetrahydropteroyltriglutamate--homocysteine S-methyltransferase [Verrucomicrobia bacterium]|nr:5-methyltetrahydropteroyltriglutamate--homocysteine S-methyltransferase [Verrucomicrobiota bacterium]